MPELLSDNDRMYYRTALQKILHALRDGQKHYTHHFEYIDVASLKGKDNRPLLRKCLRTLEADGFIKNFDEGSNVHMWQITEKGKQRVGIDNRTSDYVCFDCGREFLTEQQKQQQGGAITAHIATCGLCAVSKPVVHIRNWNWLIKM